MKRLRWAVVVAAVALAACETVSTGAPAPSAPAAIPNTPLSLGEYRNATPAATFTEFEQIVAGRYAAGLPLSAVMADLRGAQFACAAPNPGDGRGDPPAQVCRRAINANNCRHTWQVHVWDAQNDARVSRTRALYDRSCGDDGLLGAPG